MSDAIAGVTDLMGQGVPVRIGIGVGPVVAGWSAPTDSFTTCGVTR